MSYLKHNYKFEFLQGNHGIWLFVSVDGQVVFEQAGLNLEDAMKYIQAVITKHEDPANNGEDPQT